MTLKKYSIPGVSVPDPVNENEVVELVALFAAGKFPLLVPHWSW